MALGQSTIALWAWFFYVLRFISGIIPTLALPIEGFDLNPTATIPTLTHIVAKPEKIEPPAPKFKTTPDEGRVEPNLSVLAKNNLSSYDDETMVITTTEFMPGMYQARISVGNGYWGTSFAAAGPCYEKDVNQTNPTGNEVTEGWPEFNPRQTFATIGGFRDIQYNTTRTNYAPLLATGWESVSAGIPFPFGFHLEFDGHVLNSTVDKESISNFAETFSPRDGLPHWTYTWKPNNNTSFDIEQCAFVSRDDPNGGGSELRVTARGGNYPAKVRDLFDGRSAYRSNLFEKGMVADMPQIYVAVHPNGLPEVKAFTVSTANVSNGYTDESSRKMTTSKENNMTIGQEWDVHLIDGETATFRKFIGVASSDKFEQPKVTANASSTTSASRGWNATLLGHITAWNKLMSHNLIPGYRDPSTGKLPENNTIMEKFQAAAVMDRYMLLINLLPEDGQGLNDVGVSPVGMSADSYGGMVFWDQDLWMFPAMAATNPEYAMQIPKSRVKLWESAKANAQLPHVQERYPFDNESALYPWTSGRYGNATATGPAVDYQYHLNTDIAQSMLQFRRITGNETYFRENFWPVIHSVGHAITTLLRKDGGGYSIWNMTDPDEYAAKVDNGAYTLSSFSRILHEITKIQQEYGEPVNQTWVDMANNVNIHRAPSNITLEYEGMQNNDTVKQADVVLMAYPWHITDHNYTVENKRMDLDYYAQKQNPDGPAMTFAIYSTVENLYAEFGSAAFTYHQQGIIPYLRAPWYQMSEVPNDDVNGNGGVPPAFPFVTGHGGAAQVPLFGYLGLDLTQGNLTIQPSLPHPISHLQPPDFYFQGAKFRAAMNSTHTNLTRLHSDNNVVEEVYAGRSMPVFIGSPKGRREQEFYTIAVNETLTINNDMYWKTAATKDNVLQNRDTTSKSENVIGHWPGAATDGNPGTTWQPLTVNASCLTVDTSNIPFQQVNQINLQWGARPPLTAQVGFTNASDVQSFNDTRMTVVDLGNITASQPYHVLGAIDPVQYTGNSTEYVLNSSEPIYTGRYALLLIEGCKECGAMNSWTGGSGTMFNPAENTFGATVGEFEVIGASNGNMG